ncbi:RipA family octameric membrane protein [Mycobacterium colombiense]|uniref:RipA family octameric membrane protein n=1 Tax=Mycobacterium colombiense TaxID=339268 RepID=UPI00131A09C6|nr:hypothetical protein [Mycobacterium colombiense]
MVAQQIKGRIPPSEIPDEDTHELFRIYAVLLLAKGSRVEVEDVHNAWSAWMSSKDPNHRALVPLHELGADAIKSDEPFVTAIRDVATQMSAANSSSTFDATLFPNGIPQTEEGISKIIDLYKLMVASSEALVNRRQGVNTFFLTANGAIVTAAGLLLGNGTTHEFRNWGMLALAVTGWVLTAAWKSLIKSAGQLNKGKFAVINRIEEILPAAVYLAEWKALDEGNNPKKYRSFTSRETWVPTVFQWIYVLGFVVDVVLLAHGPVIHGLCR